MLKQKWHNTTSNRERLYYTSETCDRRKRFKCVSLMKLNSFNEISAHDQQDLVVNASRLPETSYFTLSFLRTRLNKRKQQNQQPRAQNSFDDNNNDNKSPSESASSNSTPQSPSLNIFSKTFKLCTSSRNFFKELNLPNNNNETSKVQESNSANQNNQQAPSSTNQSSVFNTNMLTYYSTTFTNSIKSKLHQLKNISYKG